MALLAEAAADERIFVTKDHDIGALVHRDSLPRHGVLLVDDPGNAAAETELILAALSSPKREAHVRRRFSQFCSEMASRAGFEPALPP